MTWQDKISLQDLNFKKIKVGVFIVEDDEGRPVACIEDEKGNGFCFTRKSLKTMLALIDRDFPKKRKGNTAYGAFDGDSDGKSYDDPFIPDEPKRKVCYPECGCLNC